MGAAEQRGRCRSRDNDLVGKREGAQVCE